MIGTAVVSGYSVIFVHERGRLIVVYLIVTIEVEGDLCVDGKGDGREREMERRRVGRKRS